MTGQTVLVTGATGLQGGSTARRLLDKGYKVRALVRAPESPAAVALAASGATLVEGTFEDSASIRRAAEGADAAYVMGTPEQLGPDGEKRLAISVLDAVAAAGVGHVVYSSAAAADRDTGIPWFESKKDVEAHVRTLSVPWTIVAPAVFMDVVLAPHVVGSLTGGVLQMALPPSRPLQYVDVADIAAFTELVLSRPSEFEGRRVEIASDEVDGTQLAVTLAEATGRPISYTEGSLAELGAWNAELAKMFTWFTEVGFGIDLDGLHASYPEVGWSSFDTWAAAQPWSEILG